MIKTALVKSKKDFQQVLAIRVEVFVKEQGFTMAEEIDEIDCSTDKAEYVLAFHDKTAVATGRLRFLGNEAKLERICVLKDFRKFGFGKKIIEAMELLAYEKNILKIKLHGQVRVADFYLRLGFSKESDAFMEDGVAHYLFTKTLKI